MLALIHRYKPLLSVAIGFWMMGMFIAMQGLLVGFFAQKMHVSISRVILCDSIPLFISLMVNHLAGILIKLSSAPVVRRLSVGLFSVALSVLYLMVRFSQLTIDRYIFISLLLGLALGLIYPSLNHSVLQKKITDHEKSACLTWVNVAWNIGFFSCGLFMIVFNGFHSPITLILFISLLFASDCLFNRLDVQANMQFMESTDKSSSKSSSPYFLLRLPFGIFITGLALFTITYSQNTIEYWFPVFMQQKHHVGLSGASLVMSFFGLSQAIGRAMFAFFSKKIRLFLYLYVSMVTMAASVFAFIHIFNLFFNISVMVLIGLSSSALLPVLMSLGANRCEGYQSHHTSFFIFMNTLGSCSCFVLTSLLGGYIGFGSAIVSCPILLLFSLLFVYMLYLSGVADKRGLFVQYHRRLKLLFYRRSSML